MVRNSFVLTPTGFYGADSISVPVWPRVSLTCIDFKCFEGERAGHCAERAPSTMSPIPGWNLHQAGATQEPALALMQSVALVFSSALTSGH